MLGDREPEPARIGHEVCILLDFLCADQEMAHTMAASAGHMALHHPVPEWHGLISGLAIPYSPHVIDRGPAYEFKLNHVVELDDPLEPFSITYEDL